MYVVAMIKRVCKWQKEKPIAQIRFSFEGLPEDLISMKTGYQIYGHKEMVGIKYKTVFRLINGCVLLSYEAFLSFKTQQTCFCKNITAFIC